MRYLLSAVAVILLIIAFLFLSQSNHQPITPSLKTGLEKQTPTPAISKGSVPNIAFSLPSGFSIHLFASGLAGARDLQFSPQGTLVVSVPNSNEVIALPDKNSDGVADSKDVVISNLEHAHGLAFYNGQLFVAGVNEVARYNWNENNLTASLDKILFSLPNNNDHNNHTLVFDKTGKMFVSVGSTCNVCSESPTVGGSVFISNDEGDAPQIFASGLRNAAFLAINPQTNELWGTEMGRDYLGDNLPPDEINIIRQGENYGWPNCYGDKVPDISFNPRATTASCSDTEPPIYQIQAHSAPLGLTFINSSQFPASWQGDLLVALHGSWNRSVPDGYKVVHLKVLGNTITDQEDFLTGFLEGNTVLARPVDMVFDKSGNLYLSDDKSGNIYIIQKKSS